MKKSTFDFAPNLIEHEGAVVRINFDVESVMESGQSMDGEDTSRSVFKAYVVRVAKPLTVEGIKAALMEKGFGEYKAEAVAAEVMLTLVQGGEAYGDELALAKQMVMARINDYDKSNAVNQFNYNDEPMWIPRETRELFQKRLDNEKKWNRDSVHLDFDGGSFDLNVNEAEVLLDLIEKYATDCYDVTSLHLRTVKAMESIDDVLQYEFATGYPPKINL